MSRTETKPERREAGVPCPRCGGTLHRVLRTTSLPGRIRRTRECEFCLRRFVTTERVQGAPE